MNPLLNALILKTFLLVTIKDKNNGNLFKTKFKILLKDAKANFYGMIFKSIIINKGKFII
jgi:hypothetical protein